MKKALQRIPQYAVVCAALSIGSMDAHAANASLDTGIQLRPLATHVYKTPDPGNERTESGVFWLLVETKAPRQLTLDSASIRLVSGQKTVQTTHYDADGIRALAIVPPFPPRLLDGKPSPTLIYWPYAIRIRYSAPQAFKVDGMHVEATLGEGEETARVAVTLPIEEFEQKTSLIFPVKGRGIFTNAGATNGGHRNRSGQFALDSVGLDSNYGVYVAGDGRKSENYAGWGRAIIAPAAGKVVAVRTERPDQPDPEKSDPEFYAPEYPDGGDPGNHVVIDHGNGEFSLLAHFMAGSVRIKLGERVEQGQALGKLGSSGDTETPHLHYQLQSGPDIVWSDGLPPTFTNIDSPFLVRGVYFEAK